MRKVVILSLLGFSLQATDDEKIIDNFFYGAAAACGDIKYITQSAQEKIKNSVHRLERRSIIETAKDFVSDAPISKTEVRYTARLLGYGIVWTACLFCVRKVARVF